MNIFDAEQYQINNDMNSDREPHCEINIIN